LSFPVLRLTLNAVFERSGIVVPYQACGSCVTVIGAWQMLPIGNILGETTPQEPRPMRRLISKEPLLTERQTTPQPGADLSPCAASGNGDGSYSKGANGAKLVVLLSQKDQNQLAQCEEVIRRGLSTFFEVGSALLRIRERRLYRGTHPTFELYCRERWGIGRSYAWRLIGAAERLNLLPAEGDMLRPINEFQIRPFLKLAPEAFPRAWQHVTQRAKDGKVTPSLVKAVIGELSPNATRRIPPGGKRKPNKPVQDIRLGRVLVFLQEARRSVEKHDVEQALAVLQNIETLLFAAA
jgi:hypothetical protein